MKSSTDSWALSIGLFCCKFNLTLFAVDCGFQFAGVWACAVDCCVKEGCLGDNWDELLFELLVCWKLFIICGFICCWWGESRWMLFMLKIFCWKSGRERQKIILKFLLEYSLKTLENLKASFFKPSLRLFFYEHAFFFFFFLASLNRFSPSPS